MSEHSSEPTVKSGSSNNNLIFAVVILIIIAGVAAFILLKPEEQPVQVVEDIVTEEVPVVEYQNPEPEPETSEPEPEPVVVETAPERTPEPVPEVEPLPTLNESDEVVVARMDELLSDQVMSLMVTDDLIRRGVVYVDNIAKGKVALSHAPVERPKESFKVIEGDILTIDPNSYERYTPYVKLFTSLSAAQVIRMYDEYKPLINEAYAEIGYEGDAFTGTLEEAIDVLLDTPEPKGEMPLVRNSVTYQYAYSEWENLPDAQKQLLRMGPENMKKVKAALRNIKAELEK
ncbi:DUF3014 domain-containing protein [Pseudoalteromonas sp. SSMSWG5]|jgi:hypothetical protein|uniref:DUF3014 domain-containing protein n=1 Tax=unclassified Pseudoalteromonas TaxID=194690 RepID=UPI00109398BA|nr:MULTISPECIES: DUF3014 domain-containing protein [unclassified Pseudoalteromonas]MCF2899214.1 DUF3014 domain-containing protein [Pseudoalteromonas sp. OFAV1]MCO7248341.1 DUF3014 domain-containing protein [Pseudoalteromonas sp. Ps84H-4]TGV20073.1 DUF3014 domain-containing protein [Pseudoalteromonas sp. MEBiC 03607]|tara:strand:- start:345 stop:1208 length:864 start_codon:yes stop_codon:yes gene_type:complete